MYSSLEIHMETRTPVKPIMSIINLWVIDPSSPNFKVFSAESLWARQK